jgi:peptidoglycan/xylan/chitin deacetylase (PgdA/CDA1 family)
MERATAEQASLTGMPPCAFRPPGGSYNATTESLAQQRRMKFWTWSVDTEDWKANAPWYGSMTGQLPAGQTVTAITGQ